MDTIMNIRDLHKNLTKIPEFVDKKEGVLIFL